MISERTIGYVMEGKSTSIEYARRIANALGVGLEDVFPSKMIA